MTPSPKVRRNRARKWLAAHASLPKLWGALAKRDRKQVRKAKAARKKANKQIQKQKATTPSKIISRNEWGARTPTGQYTPNAPISQQVLHHTAGRQLSANATPAEEAAEMRAIQAQHQGQGWIDIGYHLVVFPSGRIYEGRPANVLGAHVAGHNTGTVGISCAGNYEIASPTAAMLDAIGRARKALPGSNKPLVGHRDLGPTACPGKNLYSRLKSLQ